MGKLADGPDFEMIVEACYAAAAHDIAAISERRARQHQDSHKGLAKFLDDRGLTDLATSFRQLELPRSAKYYGAQGDGKSAREAKRILAGIEETLH